MDSQEFILNIVGHEGKFQETLLFEYAHDDNLPPRTKELYLLKASEIAKHRKKWIDEVKKGAYTHLGITADNVVE